ncbi:hypothetical protein OROGR_023005 [Orobanche gracilis]
MASEEQRLAIPESGNPIDEGEYYDSEKDSDDEVSEATAGALNPPNSEGPSIHRCIPYEKMLHDLDIQTEEFSSRTPQSDGNRLD